MAYDKLVDSAQLDADLTSVADTIRAKVGTSGTMEFPDGFVSAVQGIQAGGGGTDVEDALVTRTITEYTNTRVTKIAGYAFCSCSMLTSVNFPAVTDIGYSAFQDCSNLTSVNIPAAKYIRNNAFCSCSRLQTVNFPVAKSMSLNVFANCSSLQTVNIPAAKSIPAAAFYSCVELTSVSFPVATMIGVGAFDKCSSLTSVYLPAVTVIREQAFRSCSSLANLYLMGSSLCALSNSNAFDRTGITQKAGSIYVPASLLTSYQTATNWAYFSTQFVAGD
jgi:hypothetical protein